MIPFIIRRMLQTVIVLFGVTILVFSLMHITPGDPARIIAGEGAPEETIENIREKLGLNEPYHVQYFTFLGNILQGDLGTSIRNNTPVVDEIETRFWTTVELAVYSVCVAVFFGLIAGVVAAVRQYSWIDSGLMVLALFGLSMPNFWLGLMLIKYFAIEIPLFHPSGWGSWQQNVLPVITLGTGGAAIIARMTRSSMLEVINQDYIRTARAKGLKERTVIYKHALKNALIPVVTVAGLEFGGFLGGAVLTETVFAVNGMGRLVVNAIGARDFPVVQGTVLVIAALFVIVNTLVDISYRYLNKRIDLE